MAASPRILAGHDINFTSARQQCRPDRRHARVSHLEGQDGLERPTDAASPDTEAHRRLQAGDPSLPRGPR